MLFMFLFNDTETTEVYTCGPTRSLHDALPISRIERGEETAFAVLSDLRAMEEPYRDPLLAGWREVFRKTRASSGRSEEHTSELQSLMRISYAVFCLKKKTIQHP